MIVGVLLIASPLAAMVATAPADLRVQWADRAPAVEGSAGTNVELAYEVSNVGGAAAFAVVITARTTVGPIGAPLRIQPGPREGSAVRRKVTFALVRGMREICLDAVLQHKTEGEPPDPDLTNNRVCRSITIVPDRRRPQEDPR